MPAHGYVTSLGVGRCPCHPPFPVIDYTTVINVGASTVTTNNLATAVVGSLGISSCGHVTVALVGSGTVLAENAGVHRVGDTGANCGQYTLTVGSPDTFSGG